MSVMKISVALDERHVRLARRAAKAEGLSLSAYISLALAQKLADQERLDAGRKLYAAWGAETVPTAADRAVFLEQMQRPKRRPRVA
jgi:hypothetical protein